jgi:5-carboxymethyl-2-hydroxymuconic-semialdehyde dehydrogenase
MDKVTPKDVFQANRDRAAPLLENLKADGIGHIIDGKIVPSISGATFETKSPVDGAALASVARGNAEDIDRAATAAALSFKAWRDMPATMRKKLLHRVADPVRRHEIVGDRPRRRRLFIRLLHGNQARLAGAGNT